MKPIPLWQRQATASHWYVRESLSAVPRIRAPARIQIWRAGDGDAALPIAAPKDMPSVVEAELDTVLAA
jgi:hypothetical protein